MSAAATKVNRHDIRKVIFDNYNDTDTRFSNDDILEHLNRDDRYRAMNLDALDFEDVLMELEKARLLRVIAQNFNTRYYRLWAVMEPATCKACGQASYFAPTEEEKACPSCGAKMQ